MIQHSLSNNELYAKRFCNRFIGNCDQPKYIFGKNEYAKSVAEIINIDGFIDEFTIDKDFFRKPVVNNLELIPKNALILSCSIANGPLTVESKLKKYLFESLDYFSFFRYSGLNIKSIEYLNGFEEDYKLNKNKYDNIYQLFADVESKDSFDKIISFRLSYNLKYMEGFTDIQYRQYFEDFLNLQEDGEAFVDVGGYDGYTTVEFAKRCPNYQHIYFFEPDKENLENAKNVLQTFKNIDFYEIAMSNKIEKLRFENALGLSSKISINGSILVDGNLLDNLIKDKVTYIKMDIEGSECAAIEGAKQTILKYHPRLAISVYHKCNDLHTIPNQILSIRNDYEIYLRHYTEGVAETVMFFIPKR